ncbi:MAG: hypothetical protein Q8K36_03910, partial [Alphaproteobacteria bacterium]|nr:hypothetical protein [Alphaproteobacteria bacterium]
RFFYQSINTPTQFESDLLFCQQRKAKWNTAEHARLKAIPELRNLDANFAYPARCYGVVEFIASPQGAAWQLKVNDDFRINRIKQTCRPPLDVPKGERGKNLNVEPYLFLPSRCSADIDAVFSLIENGIKEKKEAEKKALENTALEGEWDTVNDLDNIVSAANESSLYTVASACEVGLEKGIVNENCQKMILLLKGAADNQQVIAYLYHPYPTPGLSFSGTLYQDLETCAARPSSEKCVPMLNNILSQWRVLDEKMKRDIAPSPIAFLRQNTKVLEKMLTLDDYEQQIAYFNFEGYQEAQDIFLHIYSMACAMDPSFRIRLLQEDRTLIEQELAATSQGVAQSTKSALTDVSRSISATFKSDTASPKEIADRLNINHEKEKFLAPAHIPLYIKNYDDLKKIIESQSPAGFDITVADLLAGQKQYISSKLGKEYPLHINYNVMYGVLSKICMAILGPEYLKLEESIRKATSAADQKKIIADISNMSQSFAQDSKGSAPIAFKNVPTNEYNKLRQIALCILTNIHIILLDDHFKKINGGKMNQFSILADQIKQAFPDQLKFLSRFFFKLKRQDYKALSILTIGKEFADAFLTPIYPTNLFENVKIDRATLLDGQGKNIYSLYASFVLGSIQGILDINESSMSFEDRSFSGRLASSVATMYGADIERGIEGVLAGAINTTLNLLPIPKPPIITGAVVTGLSMALVA